MEADDSLSVRVASFACYLDKAKENLIQRVSAQETPIMLSSPKTTTIPTKPLNPNFPLSKDMSQETLTNNLRVDSFSYLNTPGENFVFKVPGPVQDPTLAFAFSHEIPKDGEISVFGADKYFNMKLEYQTRSKHDNNQTPLVNLPRVDSGHVTTKTPSLCSEASSFNSQTALLQRSGSQVKHKRALGRRIFAGFGCQGPCFDKKAVHINEIVSYDPKLKSERIHNLAISTPIPKENLKVESLEESRNSIEVFGSSNSLKGDIASNMERKLSILTWDAIPKGQNLPTSTIGGSTFCDDMASDASSDLFEIENISGSIYPVLTADGAPDDMSSCMSPQSHYAPSEASIQWSVVTASAADYSSVVSDNYNDETSVSVAGDRVISRNNNRNSKLKNGGSKEGLKIPRPGGILGCKSQKSVEVAENVSPRIINEKGNKNLDLSFGKSEGIKGRVKAIDTLQLPRSYAMIH